MTRFRFIAMIVLAAAVGLFLTRPPATDSQEKTIKIGLIFDFSGPFSAAGSLLNYRGVKLAIDWANDKGGVLGKYKIVRVDADAQSKADVAINEAERLLNAEHVDILSGIYSRAHKAARETDILDGGTMQGYGVKFFLEASSMRGQNERAFPAVYQVIDGKFAIVYPKAFANASPVLPLPASSPFGAR